MNNYSFVSLDALKPSCNIPLEEQEKINLFVQEYNYEPYFKRDFRNYNLEEKLEKTEKYKGDNFIAKCAETVAALYFQQKHGFPSSITPDLTILKAHEKSWSADLPYNKIDKALPNIHVKSCRNISRFPISWHIQLSNTNGIGGRDSLLNNPDTEDLMCFATVEYDKVIENNKVYLKACIPVSFILKNNLLAPAIKTSLKKTKSLVYYEDKFIDDVMYKGLVSYKDVI